ncbi:DNA glycosylase, partial [Mycena floridula]
ETVAHDPWKLLVAVTLLNKTAAKLAIPVFWEILCRWPTPWTLAQANQAELKELLHPLGTYNIRAKRLIQLSKAYMHDPPSAEDPRPSKCQLPRTQAGVERKYPPTAISHLPGTGPYALDSYRIFCTPHEWKLVLPSDKELIRYLRWKWAFIESKKWSPNGGCIGPVDQYYLELLITELSQTSGLFSYSIVD